MVQFSIERSPGRAQKIPFNYRAGKSDAVIPFPMKCLYNPEGNYLDPMWFYGFSCA